MLELKEFLDDLKQTEVFATPAPWQPNWLGPIIDRIESENSVVFDADDNMLDVRAEDAVLTYKLRNSFHTLIRLIEISQMHINVVLNQIADENPSKFDDVAQLRLTMTNQIKEIIKQGKIQNKEVNTGDTFPS